MEFKTAYGKKERVLNVNEEPSLTKQSFKNECDINLIMKKWQKTGVLPQARSAQPCYGDFTGISDYQSALNAVAEAQDTFLALPSALRARFSNDPSLFLEFVQNPANIDEMISLGLAERSEKVFSVEKQASNQPVEDEKGV